MTKETIRNTLISSDLAIMFAIAYIATKLIPAPASITLGAILLCIRCGTLVSATWMCLCAVSGIASLLLSAAQSAHRSSPKP
jgi:predicted Na+-dependent transporter